MSEIDLELVKLRATVRGWEIAREWPACVIVRVPPGRLVWVQPEGAHLRNLTPVTMPELVGPRWTLDRLLSEPPEGWVYEARHERLMWQGDDGDSLCLSVSWCHDVDGWLEWDFNLATERGHHDLAAFAGQLKAAAELAYILAEIQP